MKLLHETRIHVGHLPPAMIGMTEKADYHWFIFSVIHPAITTFLPQDISVLALQPTVGKLPKIQKLQSSRILQSV